MRIIILEKRMKKILIIVIVTLSCYLGYTQLMGNEGENRVTVEDKVEENVINTSGIERVEEDPALETGVDISKISYFGLYSQHRKTDTFDAELIVEILDDTNYRHKRIVTKNGQLQEAEVQGEYKIINGSVVQLFYPEDRDKTIFPTPKALFTIKEDGSLVSGDWQLIKQ